MRLEVIPPEEDQAIARIKAMQEQYGYTQLQQWIESGQAWLLEGSIGRAADRALEAGQCFLPDQAHVDFWGNTVPGRQQLQEGTKGTLGNAVRYWDSVDEIAIQLD